MVRLKDLSLLDTGKAAILTEPETGTEIYGVIIADPMWKGKVAFKIVDNNQIIDIFDTDEIELVNEQS